MKKSFLLLATMLFITVQSFATQYMVMVANYSFTPTQFTMHLGDTVMWMWSNGTHTTTSTTIPSGAASWNANINASATTFMYVPTKLGTYQYQCNFHVSLGMTGQFTVTSPTEVPGVTIASAMNMYPNPASNELFFQFNNASGPASVSLVDATGRLVYSCQYSGVKDAELNIANMPNGVYFVSILQNNVADKRKLIVSH